MATPVPPPLASPYRPLPLSPTSAVSPQATLLATALLTGINLLNYIDRYVLPANIEIVRRDIPMTGAQQGRVLTAFLWVYMLAAPVCSRLSDRFPRKYIVSVGVALWSVATAGASFAHSLTGLTIARGAVGVGEAAYATVAPALIADYYPESRRGRIMALFFVAIPVGSALCYVLGGTLTRAYSWRDAFLVVGLPGAVFALLALTLHEPPRGQYDPPSASTVSPQNNLVTVLRRLAANRAYVYTVAGYTAYTFALGGLSLWMPTYLQRVRGMDVAHANTLFGAITVLAGLLGTAVGGALGELLRGRVRHPYLWLSGVSSLVGAPLCIAAFGFSSPLALWLAVFLAEFFLFVSTGPVNTTLVNCLPPTLRATGFALSIFVTHLLGDAISPTLIGIASDGYGLRIAVSLVPMALFVSAGVWLAGAGCKKADVAARETGRPA